MRTEEEVDKLIEGMIDRTKGRYITQACAFNKTCPRQMDLLKKALMSSASFSGLTKEMLAVQFSSSSSNNSMIIPSFDSGKKNIGNFI